MSKRVYSLLNELSDLGVLISDTQDLLKQMQGDNLVEFHLDQLKHRQSELVDELKTMSISEKRQVFVYHYLSPFETGVSITDMANSFHSLAYVLKSISMKDLSYSSPPDLEFRAVVNQSFGLVFTTKQSDQIDIGEFISEMNKSEQVVNELLLLTSVLNQEDDLQAVFHKHHMHRDTISAINKFYESIYSSNKNISLEWISPFHDSQPKTVNISSERAKFISNFIKTKKPLPDDSVSMFGMLGGISVFKKRIEFLPSDSKKPIVIKWSDDLLTTITELKLKQSYHITCTVSSVFDESTESLQAKYFLREIYSE